MKTIKKIKQLTSKGQLLPAITLAIQSTKEDSPLKDRFYQQGKLLKQLQKDYKNQLVEEFKYTNELNGIISSFLQDVNTLANNPDQVHKNYIYKRWWFWPLLLLGSYFAFKYFTKPPPLPAPEQEMTLAFHNNQYILSGSDEDGAYLENIEKINTLHQRKLQLQNLLEKKPPTPIIQFRETKSILGNTIQQIESSYHQEINNLELELVKAFETTTIEFASNSITIDEKYNQVIKNLSGILMNSNWNFDILGFIDSVGSKKRNIELSCQRADSVRTKLKELYTGKPEDLSTRLKIICGDQSVESFESGSKQGRVVVLKLVKNIKEKIVSK